MAQFVIIVSIVSIGSLMVYRVRNIFASAKITSHPLPSNGELIEESDSMESDAVVIIVGVFLILIGVLSTPIYSPFGNSAFWLGGFLLIIGIGVLVLRSRE